MRFNFTKIAVASCAFAGLALVAGCSEQVPPSAPSATTTAAAPARASVPASAQFAIGAETVESIKGMTESAACSLENVISLVDNSPNPGDAPNSYKVEKGKAYKLIGFATNKDAGTVPRSIRIALVGSQVYGIDSVTGSERPDVATFFKVPALSTAGYQADAAFDDVVAGSYNVVVIETDGATPVACPTHQTITII